MRCALNFIIDYSKVSEGLVTLNISSCLASLQNECIYLFVAVRTGHEDLIFRSVEFNWGVPDVTFDSSVLMCPTSTSSFLGSRTVCVPRVGLASSDCWQSSSPFSGADKSSIKDLSI